MERAGGGGGGGAVKKKGGGEGMTIAMIEQALPGSNNFTITNAMVRKKIETAIFDDLSKQHVIGIRNRGHYISNGPSCMPLATMTTNFVGYCR